MDINKIEIKQKEGTEGQPMTGANTIVTLNGEPVPMLTNLKFEVKAGGLAEVTMTMLGNFAISGEIGSLEKRYLI